MDIHKSDRYYMRGSGVGSIFSTIFRRLVPLAKNVVNTGLNFAQSKTGKKFIKGAKRTALDAGLNIAHDALQGQNLKQSVTKRLKNAGEELIEDIRGKPKRRKRRKKVIAKKYRGGSTKKKPKKKKKKKKTKTKTKTKLKTRKKPKCKGRKNKRKQKGKNKARGRRNYIPSSNQQLLKLWT